MQDLWKSIKWV